MKLVLAAALVAYVAVPSPSTAQPAETSGRDTLLVSPVWLADHLHDANLVVLQVDAMGNKEAYDAGHIAGARMLDYGLLHAIPKSAGEDEFATGDSRLKSTSEIAAVFDKAGVKPGDTIIGYCHVGEQATAMLFAARTLGHRIILYNGSFADWVQHNLPLELPKQEP